MCSTEDKKKLKQQEKKAEKRGNAEERNGTKGEERRDKLRGRQMKNTDMEEVEGDMVMVVGGRGDSSRRKMRIREEEEEN